MVDYEGKRTIEDPASVWFLFTGKGEGRVKCGTAKSEARCREYCERLRTNEAGGEGIDRPRASNLTFIHHHRGTAVTLQSSAMCDRRKPARRSAQPTAQLQPQAAWCHRQARPMELLPYLLHAYILTIITWELHLLLSPSSGSGAALAATQGLSHSRSVICDSMTFATILARLRKSSSPLESHRLMTSFVPTPRSTEQFAQVCSNGCQTPCGERQFRPSIVPPSTNRDHLLFRSWPVATLC